MAIMITAKGAESLVKSSFFLRVTHNAYVMLTDVQ